MTDTIETTPTVDQLLTHMRKHYSDQAIANDLDSVLSCAPNEEARAKLCLYAALRRKARGFKPGVAGENNHKEISASEIALIGTTKSVVTATCSGCNKGFVASRSDAKWCSPRCRTRGSRKASVTLNSRVTEMPVRVGNDA